MGQAHDLIRLGPGTNRHATSLRDLLTTRLAAPMTTSAPSAGAPASPSPAFGSAERQRRPSSWCCASLRRTRSNMVRFPWGLVRSTCRPPLRGARRPARHRPCRAGRLWQQAHGSQPSADRRNHRKEGEATGAQLATELLAGSLQRLLHRATCPEPLLGEPIGQPARARRAPRSAP